MLGRAFADGNTDSVGKLAADLLGPVGLELARAVEQLPGPIASLAARGRVEMGRLSSLNLSTRVRAEGRPHPGSPRSFSAR
jgi:hypothetical protein